MPAKASWLLQLTRIRAELEELDVPVVDRSCFERIFGVRRRRAIQLMHLFGGFQAGRTFLIPRPALIAALDRMERSDNFKWEQRRKVRLADELSILRKMLPGQHVTIKVPSPAPPESMAGLPAGVHLTAGELRIAFTTTQELLTRLYELGQAILNDYQRFEEICETQTSTHLDI